MSSSLTELEVKTSPIKGVLKTVLRFWKTSLYPRSSARMDNMFGRDIEPPVIVWVHLTFCVYIAWFRGSPFSAYISELYISTIDCLNVSNLYMKSILIYDAENPTK